MRLACAHLGVDIEDLKGRGRDPDIVRYRELIGLVGIERYGVKVTELAEVLENHGTASASGCVAGRGGGPRIGSLPSLPRTWIEPEEEDP